MTDNEIIKALECLTGKGIACEYKKRFPFGNEQLLTRNRQKAEIEVLKEELADYTRVCGKAEKQNNI